MSTVLVAGGTGALGRHVVVRLRERGDEVRVLSRRQGAGTHVGDLNTGAGVADAAQGAELVVHAASDFRRLGRPDIDQTNQLLEAARGAERLLYVSIVGVDSIPYIYYRNKLKCEHSVASSGVPYTILRATQFHELIGWLMRTAERLPLAPLPLDFRFQTVAAQEVATRVAELIHSDPRRGIVDFGGPEVLTLKQTAEQWRTERGRPRRLMPMSVPGRIGAAFRQGLNTCPEHAEGSQTWTQFVASDPGNPYRLRGGDYRLRGATTG
jgi:uncharacterized protein YbjT (DUF2867 family)